MSPIQLKELYQAEEVHKAFYTGGDMEWSADGTKLYCHCEGSIHILDVNEGKVIGVLNENVNEEEKDNVLRFILDTKNNFIFSAHKSGLLKIWELEDNKVIKQWKSVHKGPVSRIALNPDSNLLASGGSDSSVRLWDLTYQTCKQKLIGLSGVVSVLKFFKSETGVTYLFGAADDTCIHVWDTDSGKQVATLSGHYSTVTGIVVTEDGNNVVSCSRDNVLILWNLKTGAQIHVIPLFESAEDLVLLPKKFTIPQSDKKVSGGIYVATGGEKGLIRIWDVGNVTEIYSQQNSLIDSAKDDGGLAITHLLYNVSNNNILVSSAEHNIIIHDFDSFSCLTQLIGFSDEVLDIVSVGANNSHLVVATNSKNIKLYKIGNMNCQILKGHTDIVVGLASTPSNPCLFASSSKDNSIRVWLLDNEVAYCVAAGMLHNNSVEAVCISQMKAHFLLSGSQDTVLKKWKLPRSFNITEEITLNMKTAKVAHDKDINGIAVSPNDKLIATASMDKTAKLWTSEDLSPLGTLRGHKRGVWDVCFSPSDQVVLTSSTDSTLKLWSIADLSCLKTFEGHDSSVLKASFLSHGMQIISCGGDGLLKLWNVKTSECTASFDKHNGKIWTLAVMKGEEVVVTGGNDSQLVIWRDVTEQVRLAKAEELQVKAEKEQQLANFLQTNDLLNALRFALSLNRPATVLKIFQEVIDVGDSELVETVNLLEDSDKYLLLKCASNWNSNSKYCYPAQVVFSLLLEDIAIGKLKPSQEVLESFSAYTERHFKRLTQHLQDLHILEYTKQIMKPHYVDLKMNE